MRITGFKNTTRSEKGVALVAFAVMAGVLVFFLLFLGIGTARVNRARTLLDGHATRICKEVAQFGTASHSEALQYFRTRVNDLMSSGELVNISLRQADILIPTMPAISGTPDYEFFYSIDAEADGDIDACDDPAFTPIYDPVAAATLVDNTFVSIFGPGNGCNLAGGNDCRFVYGGAVCNAEGTVYPSGLATNFQDVGQTVFCEFAGDVIVPFSPDKPIRSKAVWSNRLRAPEPVYDPANVVSSSQALSIFVGPEMTTMDTSPSAVVTNRFTFDRLNSAYSPGVMANHSTSNPAYAPYPWMLTYSVNSRAHKFNNPPQPMPGWYAANVAAFATPAVVGAPPLEVQPFPQVVNPVAVVNTAAYPGFTAFHRDLTIALHNPPNLIRNIIAAVLLEGASRTSLRNQTEVAMLNPYHDSVTTVGAIPAQRNWPATILRYTEDIRLQNTSVPYTFYDAGYVNGAGANITVGASATATAAAAVSAPLGQTQGSVLQGYLFPFRSTNPAPGPPQPYMPGGGPLAYGNPALDASLELTGRVLHTLLSSQARFGYHAYDGVAGPFFTSNLWRDEGFYNNTTTAVPAPIDFEPAPLFRRAGRLAAGLGHTSLDHENPWSSRIPPVINPPGFPAAGTLADIPCDTTNGADPAPRSTRCTSAIETVLHMGTIQRCPAQYNWAQIYALAAAAGPPVAPAGLPYNGLAAAPWAGVACIKPPLGSGGVNGPLELSADVLAGLDSAIAGVGSRVRRPGIFPLDLAGVGPTNLVSVPQPMGASSYEQAPAVDSHVVFILHQRLRIAGNEPAQIFARVAQINSRNRPVTVFYIPTNRVDASPAAINAIRVAFNDSTTASPTLNKVFVFYPDDPVYGGTYQAGPTEDDDFQKYWADLLDPTKSNYIVKTIRDLFYSRILRLELQY